MAEVPSEMMQRDQVAKQDFKVDEKLFRRIPPELWDDGEPDIDAVQLPDMSVNRSSLGPAWWTRLDAGKMDATEWGVVAFDVGDIPSPLLEKGVFHYTFHAVHEPKKYNYPHSVVQCHEGDKHIDAKAKLDHELHLRWRERLLRVTRPVILPGVIPPAQRAFFEGLEAG